MIDAKLFCKIEQHVEASTSWRDYQNSLRRHSLVLNLLLHNHHLVCDLAGGVLLSHRHGALLLPIVQFVVDMLVASFEPGEERLLRLMCLQFLLGLFTATSKLFFSISLLQQFLYSVGLYLLLFSLAVITLGEFYVEGYFHH